MSGFFATLRRELISLWFTPLAWILFLALVMLQGGVFASIVASFARSPELTLDVGPLQAFYGQSVFVPLTLVFLCPVLAMRTFAEERRAGTIENILAAPVGISAVVLGKYVATLVTFMVLWLPSVAFPMLLRRVIDVEWRVVATSYLGIFGLGAGFLAVGVLCSAMTRSQFVALATTGGLILVFVLLGVVEYTVDGGWVQSLCAHVAIQSQLAEMSQGVVATKRLVFDASLIAFPLYLAVRVAESWRWA